VQVKARAGKASASEVRELAGVLGPDEHGLFVSSGGFTRDADHEAEKRGIKRMDLDRLMQLLLDLYEELDQDTKVLLPLRRVYFP
jgi:restriction system protein